jgi:hypothetical protein
MATKPGGHEELLQRPGAGSGWTARLMGISENLGQVAVVGLEGGDAAGHFELRGG